MTYIYLSGSVLVTVFLLVIVLVIIVDRIFIVQLCLLFVLTTHDLGCNVCFLVCDELDVSLTSFTEGDYCTVDDHLGLVILIQ